MYQSYEPILCSSSSPIRRKSTARKQAWARSATASACDLICVSSNAGRLSSMSFARLAAPSGPSAGAMMNSLMIDGADAGIVGR